VGPDEQVEPTKEQPRTTTATAALIILTILVVGGVVTYLGPILQPFLVAVFLYYATRPAADALVRRRIPPWLAYLTLFLVSVVVITTVGLFVYGEVLTFRSEWPRYQDRIVTLVGQHAGEMKASVQEMVKVSASDVFAYLFERGMHVAELVIMAFFYLLFLILGSAKLPGRVERAFPGERGQRILEIGRRIRDGMETFMKVKTFVSIGMAVTAGVVLWLFGLEHWLLWAFLFFALNYITYIGSIVACVPPIVFAYLELDSPVRATILGVLIVATRILWIDYIEIRMSGKHLNIDSVLLFLWLAYWGWTWGVLGLILAYPMIASLKIILEHLAATRGWAELMSEE
jgi:predicted PurR-regulated permease PerM